MTHLVYFCSKFGAKSCCFSMWECLLCSLCNGVQKSSDYGAFPQTIQCRSNAVTVESMHILKNPCDSPLKCKPRSSSNKNCNSSQKEEDEMLSRFAPILKQRLHDALEPILWPVACELRSQAIHKLQAHCDQELESDPESQGA